METVAINVSKTILQGMILSQREECLMLRSPLLEHLQRVNPSSSSKHFLVALGLLCSELFCNPPVRRIHQTEDYCS